MEWITETGAVLYCAIIIFLQAGFLLLENKSSTVAVRIFTHCAVVGVATYVLYGPESFLKVYAFAITAAAIPGLAMGDPLTTRSYIAYSSVFGFILYPIANFLVWGSLPQFLAGSNLESPLKGMVDYAGSTGVHVLGGLVAIPLLLMFNKRMQELNHDHQMIALAGGIFLTGFLGFNCVSGDVSPLNVVAVNTMIASFGGVLGVMIFSRKPADIVNGLIAGLVTSCAGAAAVNTYVMLVASFVAGIAFYYAFVWLKNIDPIGVIASHAVPGLIGTLIASQTTVQFISIPLVALIVIPIAAVTGYIMAKLDDQSVTSELSGNHITFKIECPDFDYAVGTVLRGKVHEALSSGKTTVPNIVLDLSKVQNVEEEDITDVINLISRQCSEKNGKLVTISKNEKLKNMYSTLGNAYLFTSKNEALATFS